jgi:hypothetical protein
MAGSRGVAVVEFEPVALGDRARATERGGKFAVRGSIGLAVRADRLQPVEVLLSPLYPTSRGEPAWPPLAARVSFRHFCGSAAHEPTPERTAFVRFRRALNAQSLAGCRNS